MYIILLQDGNTALLLTCIKGKVDVVTVLLQAGADKSIQNKVRNIVCFWRIVYIVYIIFICINNVYVVLLYTCVLLCIQKGETALSVASTEEIKKILVDYGECSIPIIPILYVTV